MKTTSTNIFWRIISVVTSTITLFQPALSQSLLERISREYDFEDKIYKEVFHGRDFIYLHVISDNKTDKSFKLVKGEVFAKIAEYPPKFSEKYHNEFLAAENLYNRGDFIRADELLKKPVAAEPQNIFLLNLFAKSSYWAESLRDSSFHMYERVLDLLDSQEGAKGKIEIDLWFVDAYWKYGSLLLDRAEYKKAIYEISRSLMSGILAQNEQILEQAFTFLAEAYFHLKNYESANYYGNITLLVNANNTDVRDYITEPNN